MTRPGQADAGFTLIEVLIAFAILGVALAVLMTIFSDNVRAANNAKSEVVATELARSLVDRVGNDIPAIVGSSGGDFPDGYRWNLQILPFGSVDHQNALAVKPMEVAARVSWGAGSGARSVELRTLRLVAWSRRP